MDIVSSLAVVAFAGLIHASFQLSVSVLTMLSGHAIGTKKSHATLLRLSYSFSFGALCMTTLLLSFAVYVVLHTFGGTVPTIVWAVVSGMVFGVGIAVGLLYYRNQPGTATWLPRGLATILRERIKDTRRSAEAFSLGLTSVLAEILFVAGPLILSAFVISQLPGLWQLVATGLYVAVSALSLVIVVGLVGSGHSLSRVQRWRETNKRFLQFAGGGGLIILAVFVYVNTVVASSGGLS